MPMLSLRQPLVPGRGAEDTNSGSPFLFSYLFRTLPALAALCISPIFYKNTQAASTNRASATWLSWERCSKKWWKTDKDRERERERESHASQLWKCGRITI